MVGSSVIVMGDSMVGALTHRGCAPRVRRAPGSRRPPRRPLVVAPDGRGKSAPGVIVEPRRCSTMRPRSQRLVCSKGASAGPGGGCGRPPLHCAPATDGTCRTRRCAGSTDAAPGPSTRASRSPGRAGRRAGRRVLRLRCRQRRPDDTRDDAPDVGIDWCDGLTERSRSHRTRGVGPDSRQRLEHIDRRRGRARRARSR